MDVVNPVQDPTDQEGFYKLIIEATPFAIQTGGIANNQVEASFIKTYTKRPLGKLHKFLLIINLIKIIINLK
ncbi:MAG: hypothetical protein ACP5NS_04885 [Candidatus Pacearchaeota archaeon]